MGISFYSRWRWERENQEQPRDSHWEAQGPVWEQRQKQERLCKFSLWVNGPTTWPAKLPSRTKFDVEQKQPVIEFKISRTETIRKRWGTEGWWWTRPGSLNKDQPHPDHRNFLILFTKIRKERAPEPGSWKSFESISPKNSENSSQVKMSERKRS